MKENLAGKGPAQIFTENVFDLKVIETKKVQPAFGRLRRIYNTHGELVFQEERRGKASTGRPSTKEASAENKLEKAELELLKKLEEAFN